MGKNVKVISPANLPCDCMTPPFQCEASSYADLPACTQNGLVYTVRHSSGAVVNYQCYDGEWIPIGREVDPVMGAIQSVGLLQTPLPNVGTWNDVSFNNVIKDTGGMTATNSLIVPYAGIWQFGYVLQPQLPQHTVGNMVSQMYFSSATVTAGFGRSQVNFETTNPPTPHYNLHASVTVPAPANATVKLQALPSHADMGLDYRYMWALLITRIS